MSVYCVSDIHGDLERFEKLLEKINFSDEDTMYVIDRKSVVRERV